MSITRPHRPRNARGQGLKLRTEIVAAAGRLIDEVGGVEAVTLRGVAREAGVSAPSVYAHFPDRGAIVQAVIANGFAELVEDIERARDAQIAPVARLKAGVGAILRFACAQPARFAVMLGRLPGATTPEPRRGPDDPATVYFHLVVHEIDDCIHRGVSSCTDPHLAATAIMAATHGYALVKAQKPTFPWPSEDELVTYYVAALARISSPLAVLGMPCDDPHTA